MSERTPARCPYPGNRTEPCGGDTFIDRRLTGDELLVWVECSACGARGPARYSEDQAIERWNRVAGAIPWRVVEGITSQYCSCGGMGPDDPGVCPACEIYHAIQARKARP